MSIPWFSHFHVLLESWCKMSPCRKRNWLVSYVDLSTCTSKFGNSALAVRGEVWYSLHSHKAWWEVLWPPWCRMSGWVGGQISRCFWRWANLSYLEVCNHHEPTYIAYKRERNFFSSSEEGCLWGVLFPTNSIPFHLLCYPFERPVCRMWQETWLWLLEPVSALQNTGKKWCDGFLLSSSHSPGRLALVSLSHPGGLNAEPPLLDLADQWHVGSSSSLSFFSFLSLVVVFSCHADVHSSQRKRLLCVLCPSAATIGQMTSWVHHFLAGWCSSGFMGHPLSLGTSLTARCSSAGLQVPSDPEVSYHFI